MVDKCCYKEGAIPETKGFNMSLPNRFHKVSDITTGIVPFKSTTPGK